MFDTRGFFMRFKVLFSVAFAAGVVSSPAFAEGFTGARIEAHAGYDHVSAKLKYEDTAFPDDNVTAKESTSGLVYGGGIGYDFPVSEIWIVGVEANFDLANNDRCEEVFGDDAACFKVKRDLSVGARLGAVMSKSTMFYVGAAYVNGKAKISYTDDLDPTNDFAISDTRGGWRLSTGVEVALASKVYAKAEYRYSHYSRYKASVGTESLSLGFDRHQALAGLGVRF
jgi:outer membrane immunogenic protein